MNDTLMFVILGALTIAVVGWILVQGLFALLEANKRKLQERLSNQSGADEPLDNGYGPLTNEEIDDSVGDLFRRFRPLDSFGQKLHRAFPTMPLSKFLLICIGAAAAAALVAEATMNAVAMAVLAGVAGFIIPFLVVSMVVAKKQRIMDDQLPEVLDFLARVLRAGHSLATGLQMGADELPDPLASEFRLAYGQHGLGEPLDVVLKRMAARVGTKDFAFFVTAVLIQRTTGGDLAEVLTNISGMIRARIRLKQHVKAITAQGRYVGYILLVLPIVFFMILWSINPQYAGILLHTKEGLYVLVTAVVLQLLGLVSIRRIVNVKM